MNFPQITFSKTTDYEAFQNAMWRNGRRAYLSALTPEDFARGESYLSDCGDVGYRIVDGDLQSVFSNSPVKGAGASAVLDAIMRGARSLDCFDGFLPSYYRRFGFVEVERDTFADEYAPDGWNYDRDGRPDVVYMRYHGGNPANLKVRLENGSSCLPTR